MVIKIITEKGFARIEMPPNISERELLNAKNILDRTLHKWTEKHHKPKMSFYKKFARFIRRLYRKLYCKIKKSLSAKPRRTEITVFRQLLIEATEISNC